MKKNTVFAPIDEEERDLIKSIKNEEWEEIEEEKNISFMLKNMLKKQ